MIKKLNHFHKLLRVQSKLVHGLRSNTGIRLIAFGAYQEMMAHLETFTAHPN